MVEKTVRLHGVVNLLRGEDGTNGAMSSPEVNGAGISALMLETLRLQGLILGSTYRMKMLGQHGGRRL